MTELKTTYLGLELRSPIIASASPITGKLAHLIELDLAGAGAVVLPSLFEEEIEKERRALEYHFDSEAAGSLETSSYFVDTDNYQPVIGAYLELVNDAVENLSVPVIASINAASDYGWIDIARQIEQAGASALELNIYSIPSDFSQVSVSVENNLLAIIKLVRENVNIPIAVKLGPWYSSVGNLARKIEDAGAQGIVMFNRFYQPDFDINKLEIKNTLELSHKHEIRVPLTWIGMLYKQVNLSLAASTGVETHEEVIKYLMAGADAVMTTSALLRYGPGYVTSLEKWLREWMQARGYRSVDQLRGCMSHLNVEAQRYERVQYLKTLRAYEV